MSTTSDRRKIGEIRPSQLLYTFGVGATVELPNLSVMVMGLDDWPVEHTGRPRLAVRTGAGGRTRYRQPVGQERTVW